MRRSLKTTILVGTFLTALIAGDKTYGIKALDLGSSISQAFHPGEEGNTLYQKQLSYDSNTYNNSAPQTNGTAGEMDRNPSPDKGQTESNADTSLANNAKKTNKATGENAVFLGDSITEGLSIYGFFPKSKIIGVNSLNTISAREHIDEVVSQKPSKLFIMLGINDIWEGDSVDEYIDRYKALIKDLKTEATGCKIYVESLFPVSQYAMERNQKINNKIIDDANNKIRIMARETGVTYIDVNSAFKDSKGNLRSEYTNDGVHIIDYYYTIWTSILEKYVK